MLQALVVRCSSRFFLCSAILLIGSAAFPQVSAPPTRKRPTPPPQPPAVEQEQIIPYWTTETGWTSELQLRNNAAGQELTVTPVLRLSDGTETALASVTIKPQEVKSVDISAAVAAAAAPQLVATYGSAALRFRSPSLGSLYAAMMIRSIGHAIVFHVDAGTEYQQASVGGREGIWWLPKETTSDYLILTNEGGNALPIDLSLYDAGGKENRQKVLLGPYTTSRFSVRKLAQEARFIGMYGGIKVAAATHAGALNTLHFIFDESANFSAILKMFNHDPNAKVADRDFTAAGVWTLRAPMLALSNPDPALAFPPGITLQPQLFIRNTTGKVVNASLRFNWRGGTTTGNAPGPQLQLLPYETRRVDARALQDGQILPKEANWTSVTLTTNTAPDQVMAVAASYDATLKYGAQTPFSDQLSHEWKGGMWEVDAHHGSIITAGNGGAEPTQAAFTLFYDEGRQKYELEQILQPDEQMWIDVGKLIRERVPDKNGNPLPTDLKSGSYEIRDLTHPGLGALFEGKVIYDKTYGHAAYGCATCCGYNSAMVFYNPIGVPILGPPADDGVWGYNVCDQSYDDVSMSFESNWVSGNTSIVTVDADGTHWGQSVGSTTSSTFGYIEGTAPYPYCLPQRRAPSGSVKAMTLTCSPSPVTRGSTATCTVTNAPTGATFSNWKFVDSSNNTVTSGNTANSWAGTMVTGGTVSVMVTAGAGSATLSASITVNNRNWHTNPASAANVPNDTFITLPVPPQPTCGPSLCDSGLGYFKWDIAYNAVPRPPSRITARITGTITIRP